MLGEPSAVPRRGYYLSFSESATLIHITESTAQTRHATSTQNHPSISVRKISDACVTGCAAQKRSGADADTCDDFQIA